MGCNCGTKRPTTVETTPSASVSSAPTPFGLVQFRKYVKLVDGRFYLPSEIKSVRFSQLFLIETEVGSDAFYFLNGQAAYELYKKEVE